jgi:hypothetical protein
MSPRPLPHRARLLPLALVVPFLVLASGCQDDPGPVGLSPSAFPALAVEESGSTTTGQDFEINLALDPDQASVPEGTTVTASTRATLGSAAGQNVVYVVDVSGSMRNPTFNPPQPALGDCDGDGESGTAMDAACLGLIALNESLGASPGTQVGLVAFARGAKTADMSPEAGIQTFLSPPNADVNANGIPDAEEVIRSLRTTFGGSAAAGIGLFTNNIEDGFALGTYYNSALTAMNGLQDTRPPEEGRTSFFLSDGNPGGEAFTTGPGSPLQAAVDAGTVIYTFGVGGGAANACSAGAPLRVIADQTGGSCTEVSDPSQLSAVLTGVLTRITKLELEVNGTLVSSKSGAEPFEMEIEDVDITSALVIGMNTVESTATAEDGTEISVMTTIEVVAAGDPGDPVDPVDPADPIAAEGCSPGFWSQNGIRSGSWPAGYDPADSVDSVFGSAAGYLGSTSLLGALQGYRSVRGPRSDINGASEILLRQGVAAVLNAESFGSSFPASVGGVVDAVNAALDSGDRAEILTLASTLDEWNNAGCSLPR